MAGSDFPPPPPGFGQPIPQPSEPAASRASSHPSSAVPTDSGVLGYPDGSDVAPEHGYYSFAQSVKTCMRLYTQFRGRAPRSQFWWFLILWYALYLIGASIDLAAGWAPVATAQAASSAPGPVTTVLGAALFLPLCAAYSRRMHDVGHTGLYICWSFTGIGFIWVVVRLLQSGGANVDNGFGVRP